MAENGNKRYNIKGRGYQTRDMQQLSNGTWIIPMYRNRDDAMLGSFEVPASQAATARKAFEIVRKQCWAEYSSGY
jgi:hypothetical protein